MVEFGPKAGGLFGLSHFFDDLVKAPDRDAADPDGSFIDEALFIRGQIKMLLHAPKPNISQRIAQDHMIAGHGHLGVAARAIKASSPFTGAHLAQAKGALIDFAAGPVDRLFKDEFAVRCHAAHAVDVERLVDAAVAPDENTIPACGAREKGRRIKAWAHGRGGCTASGEGENGQNAGKIFYHEGTIAPMGGRSQCWFFGGSSAILS